MSKLNISLLKNRSDTTPEQVHLTFDDLFANYLSLHMPRADKDGPMFSGATYDQNQTVIEISIGIFDFEGVDPTPIRQTLVESRCRSAIVSTHSHSPTYPCFRVVIPLTAPIPAHLWQAASQVFDQQFDGKFDRIAKVASQAYYLPSCAEENLAHAFAYQIQGLPFDAMEVMQELSTHIAERHFPTVKTGDGRTAAT